MSDSAAVASPAPKIDRFLRLMTSRGASDFHLTVGRPHEHKELVDKGLISPLDDLVRRFGFTIADDTATGFIRPRLQAYLGDHLVAIPADGDVALMEGNPVDHHIKMLIAKRGFNLFRLGDVPDNGVYAFNTYTALTTIQMI